MGMMSLPVWSNVPSRTRSDPRVVWSGDASGRGIWGIIAFNLNGNIEMAYQLVNTTLKFGESIFKNSNIGESQR